MDVSTILTMAQTILQLLDSSVMKEIESIWSFRSQLTQIKKTMSTIHAVLTDAERQEKMQVERSKSDRVWLEQLRDVVYEADDLFDEVATVAQQEKLIDDGDKMVKKVRLFLSRPAFACKVSREVKDIRERLDDIARVRRDFGSSSGQPIISAPDQRRSTWRRKRDESHSFIRDADVIGRDQDKEVVIDMLLDPSVMDNVSFVKIVGIGGLGKTTLAQLVYNDDRIDGEFSVKIWVCVSDDFNIKTIVSRILGLRTRDDSEMEELQSQLRAKIDGQKYLLVLDDLWNDNLDEWLKLRNLLVGGKRGSRIVVTTRSRKVANILGNGPRYELQGLSEDDSWRLFEKLAFNEGREKIDDDDDDEYVEIGKVILKKCANVPLAIRVVGSLLNGQSKSKWQSIKNHDLASIKGDDENSIMLVLKLSYYHLASPLKSCFRYCAVFPKDYEIDKEGLISMWIAQGFIGASNGQSLEEVGEDYFMELLERCFFQGVVKDCLGSDRCKIHDLMHDLAQEVAGSEVAVADFTRHHFEFDQQVRHLRISNPRVESIGTELASMKRLRTILNWYRGELIYQPRIDHVPSSSCLRVLDISHSNIKNLPSRIDDKLVHLRYLDLSWNHELEVLPKWITKLLNLQTVKLHCCFRLKELPRGFSKLVNLRQLDIRYCSGLTHMPPGMNKLTCLQKLPLFRVGAGGCLMEKKVRVGQLEELGALTSLRGCLLIDILKGSKYNGVKVKEAQCLSRMEHLKEINLRWPDEAEGRGRNVDQEALLEGLQPHHNVRRFSMSCYEGVRFPNWGILFKNTARTPPLSNLVEIFLTVCCWLQHLPSLSQLRFLKVLVLKHLCELEYAESSSSNSSDEIGGAFTTNPTLNYFPSLETLKLEYFPNLKGWWRPTPTASVGVGGEFASFYCYNSFPRLSSLTIKWCPNLTCLPLCQKLEELVLCESLYLAYITVNACKRKVGSDELSSSIGSPLRFLVPNWQFQQQQQCPVFSLKRVKIDDVGYLKSLPLESFQCLSDLTIYEFEQERCSTVEAEVFRTRLSSLRSLEISGCRKLRSLSLCQGGWEHLSSLESLSLNYLPELDFNLNMNNNNNDNGEAASTTADDNSMPWRCLSHTLRSLNLKELPKLINLPEGMQHLTSLHSLEIDCCGNLESLPEWLTSLTSLKFLTIREFSERLRQRCQQPNGEDWPKIQHIAHVSFHASPTRYFE